MKRLVGIVLEETEVERDLPVASTCVEKCYTGKEDTTFSKDIKFLKSLKRLTGKSTSCSSIGLSHGFVSKHPHASSCLSLTSSRGS